MEKEILLKLGLGAMSLLFALPSQGTELPRRIELSRETVQWERPSLEPGPADGETESREYLIEIRQGKNGERYRVHYPAETRVPDLIENLDPVTGATIGFKHRYLSGGEEHWTTWLPALLHRAPVASARSAAPALQDVPDLDAELGRQEERHALFAELAIQNEAPSWTEPGEHGWSYDSSKIRIWHGYLWDFKNGAMFRGFRKPTAPEEILTPSQNLNVTEAAKIREYYSRFPEDYADQFTEANSRWLSPLDKWGVWASRKLRQRWWISSGWEASTHFLSNAWGGYCNASTTLSYLWKKPLHGVVDQGVTFDPRDLVGLMQVASYKVDYYFWGARYNGSAHEDIADPSPHFAIELLRRYIGENGMPIIFDHEAGPSVGNILAVAARVKIAITEDPLVRKGVLEIDSTGNMEDDLLVGTKEEEALVPDWTWGTATKAYPFTLFLDADGKVKRTEWENKDSHPDFFWFPTDVKDYPAPYSKNPYVPVQTLRELLSKSYSAQTSGSRP